MDITFPRYPSNNRVPGAFADIDPSKANSGQANLRSLIVGQMLFGSNSLVPGVAVLCQGVNWTKAQAGAASMLAEQARLYRLNDDFGEVWLLPLLDNPAGVAASGGWTFGGAATLPGTLTLYIAAQRVQVLVPAGATPTQVAAAASAACASVQTLPVAAAAAAGVLTLTAVHKGAAGNDIDLRLNYLGLAGGEALPPGLTAVVTPMAGGTANPDLAIALMNLAEAPFDFIALPFTDAASLNEVQAFLGDATGRWAWSQMIYGHAFAAKVGTIGQLTTFGTTRNDQHASVMGYVDSPSPPWAWSAALTATAGKSLRDDPALPLNPDPTTALLGILPPPVQSRFVLGDRNTLLYDGVSTFAVDDGGTVLIERVVTTYQTDAAGSPDDSYLNVERMATLAYVCRDLRTYLRGQFARKKLVSDATRVTGTNIVSSATIKASVISRYRLLEQQGYVQNSDVFAASVQVQAAGRGLVKILWPGDLTDGLREIAILVQFVSTT